MMRKGTRRELAKSRELLQYFLRGKKCCFCHKLLQPENNKVAAGNSDGSPVARDLTIHHRNGDHDDDRPTNLTLTHTNCHKSYHMRLLWKSRILNGRKSGK